MYWIWLANGWGTPKIPMAPPVTSRFSETTRRISTNAMVARARKMPRRRSAGTPTISPSAAEASAATTISSTTSETG